jgi:hypothetical protein
LIEGEHQRRAVELAERFADGTGRVVEWERGEGNGRFLRFRNMLKGPDEGAETVERESILRELQDEKDSLSKEEYYCRYEKTSPMVVAEWTLDLSCGIGWWVADFAARSRASPIPHWKREFDQSFHQGWDGNVFEQRYQAETLAQSIILRDILGNPFRPVTIDPAWLTPEVVTLARTIYEDRTFDRMPSLGLVLEGAGCDDADILAHCGSQTEHVRGCWVVDAILGKS